MKHKLVWLAAVLPWLLTRCAPVPVPGSVEACAYVKQAEIALTASHNLFVAPVVVDGSPLRLIVDTGAGKSALSDEAADQRRMQTDWTRQVTSTGLNGQRTRFDLKPDSFVLGGIPIPHSNLSVVPITLPGLREWADGVLGMDVLTRFDVDLDLAASRMVLYQWRDCPAGRPAWDFAFGTVPLSSSRSQFPQLVLEATLDGKPLFALLDSGAAASTVTERFVTSDSRADSTFSLYGVGPTVATARLHRFDELRVASTLVRQPNLVVTNMSNQAIDMLLGADFLRRRRVWISYASGRLYVAPHVKAAHPP